MARIVVAGSPYRAGTGKIIASAAAGRGHTIRYVSDLGNPARPDDLGELTDAATVLEAADAVVLVPQRGDARIHTERATRVLLEQVRRHRPAAHFVLFSSFAVGHGPAHPLNRINDTLLPARVAAEQLVRAGGLPYTIVRPTWMTDDPPGSHALTLSQHPHGDGMVARSDMAAAIVAAIEQPASRSTTFSLFNEPGTPVADWAAAFAALRRDEPQKEL
ncbi:NAD(P)-binding oxidoreductase [Streptomyces xanthophaeus]|uniref:NAD(P)-binding oxidoreductase n=1 Tax=Streptomyces xanthophaeus TaxID=67385 RepID=UPI0026478E7F|nr:NAD(P)-binding oxidoreductase [Streptomyces xanthophaeus]WKD30530.1 SDR family oxidoreductase [Streptomyces xanthophaeus]